jgi:hypothetical protein
MKRVWLLLVVASGVWAQDQQNTSAEKSDFLNVCREFSHDDGSLCVKVQQKLFAKGRAEDPTFPLTPALVGAPALPVDKRIQFVLFNDANYLPGVAYCYFVFRGWISPNQITPDILGLKSTGFAILNEDIDKYEMWLTTPPGQACRKRIESESQVPVTDLKLSLQGRAALIGLNPLGAVQNASSLEAVMNEMRITINHERIHAYQVLCPSFDVWSQKQWEALKPNAKAKIAKTYPAYNWKDLKVAGREFVAYALEKEPEKVKHLIGKCKVD